MIRQHTTQDATPMSSRTPRRTPSFDASMPTHVAVPTMIAR
jgi:hypothetical protein